jgi:hypothetical protein
LPTFILVLQFLRDLHCLPDVPALSAFVATAEQDNESLSATGEIDAVAGAVVYPKLGYWPADWLCISGVASRHAADAANDVKDGALIFQGAQPACEFRRSRISITENM